MNEHLDWQACADEYDACRVRVTALIAEATDAQLATTVQACPAWTVKDACAHLAAIPVALVAGDLPGADGDAWVDAQIEVRRDRTAEELMAEWAAVTPAFMKLMVEAGGQVAGLVLDAIAHEHDIRHAIEQPGARESAGVIQSLGFTKMLMDRDLRTAGSTGVVRFSCDQGTWQSAADRDAAASAEPTITLDLSGQVDGAFHLMRALGSRRSLEQLGEMPWQGDWMAARGSVFHMPLPDQPLIE